MPGVGARAVGPPLGPGAPTVQKWAEGRCEQSWEAYSGCCLTYIHVAIDFLYVFEPFYFFIFVSFICVHNMVIGI